MGRVSDLDEAEIVDMLGRDVVATLGSAHLDVVRSTARHHRQFTDDRDWYLKRVVEDFQQYVHDCFIDTSWPACPVHPNHPMWFQGGWWIADGQRVAKLGGLGELLK
jgi:hypothetical protein